MAQFEIECQCAGQPLNPGQPGCVPMAGRDKFPIFMYMTGTDGTANSIPAGTVINQAYVTAKLNAPLSADRWWIMPSMFNVAEPPAEAETEDRDGIPVPTGEENKQPVTYEHSKEDANPALKAVYDSLKCNDIGVIFITIKGQLNGMNNGSGDLIPIKLQGETLTAQYSAPVKGQLQKMMCSFLMDELENDANRDFIESASIAYATKNWFALQPIEVIMIELSQADQDTIVVEANTLYGGVNFKTPVTGLVAADISPDDGSTTATVYNSTDAANVVTTLAESSPNPGQYTFTLAAPQTPGDIIFIDLFKSGYGMRTFKVTIIAS